MLFDSREIINIGIRRKEKAGTGMCSLFYLYCLHTTKMTKKTIYVFSLNFISLFSLSFSQVVRISVSVVAFARYSPSLRFTVVSGRTLSLRCDPTADECRTDVPGTAKCHVGRRLKASLLRNPFLHFRHRVFLSERSKQRRKRKCSTSEESLRYINLSRKTSVEGVRIALT